MNNKLQIFISSTFTDLISERQAAVEAILKSGHIPAGMELFTAGDKSQWEIIQRWIQDSDIYMLILGGRYGSIDPTTGLSYTEMEYDFAISMNKPFFAVIINEKALDKKIKKYGKTVIEIDEPGKLKTFRAKVLTKISSFFDDQKDIKLAVLEAIPQMIAEYELKGWIKATEIPDTKAISDKLIELSTENKNLLQKLNEQSKALNRNKPTLSEKEFHEISNLLSEIQIDIKPIKEIMSNAESFPDTYTLLDFAFANKDTLMTGVTNRYGISDFQSFLFFNICPKLQTYELMDNEKVAGAQHRRYTMSKKGILFFAQLEKISIRAKIDNTGKEKSVTEAKKKVAKKKSTKNFKE